MGSMKKGWKIWRVLLEVFLVGGILIKHCLYIQKGTIVYHKVLEEVKKREVEHLILYFAPLSFLRSGQPPLSVCLCKGPDERLLNPIKKKCDIFLTIHFDLFILSYYSTILNESVTQLEYKQNSFNLKIF